ncbi:MAG: hypothetical protein IJS03_06110 [Eubacterium sp.]|nr:hypothetical protein [Eubacterium sp.]
MFKRMLTLAVSIVFVTCTLLGRVGFITLSGNYAVAEGYNSYSIFVDANEPQLYFRNGEKINNNLTRRVAVIRPVTEDLSELQKYYNKTEIADITSELKSGYPVVRSINTNNTELKTLEVFDTNTTLSQLISKESSGILSHIDLAKRQLNISFLIDAKGRVLSGDRGKLQSDGYYSREGYVLTLEKGVQDIAYSACKDLKSGCAVIMDMNSGNVLALVNKPDSSYVNKVFNQYCVGSVFKVAVAACAIENGVDFTYNCTGSVKVGDTVFNCSKNHAHGAVSLKSALANSCNCYFITLAQMLGADKLLDTADKLGFNNYINVINDFKFSSANLPSRYDLQSKGELSLFGFGQGKLTATPLQICSMLCTVSSGNYKTPEIVYAKKEKNSSVTELKTPKAKRVLTTSTTEKMLDYLRYVVTDGTGYNAETSAHKSAGKTATAQTGQYFFGNELYNTWFAGVYPFDNPKYAIVIMCENGTSGASDCCPIFSTIVEMLEHL